MTAESTWIKEFTSGLNRHQSKQANRKLFCQATTCNLNATVLVGSLKFILLCPLQHVTRSFGSFPFLPPPPALLTKLLFPPLADMLSWAVWFKFLLNKVIAKTYLFILTSFSKQSASWKVLEICELCALSTDSRKTYSVIKYMYTGSSSYSFDWGGNNPLGGKKRKRPVVSWLNILWLTCPCLICANSPALNPHWLF